jgi:hypothetical protein
MIMFEVSLVVMAIGIAILAVYYLHKIIKDPGCGGDCYQGRRECNCKRNKVKE